MSGFCGQCGNTACVCCPECDVPTCEHQPSIESYLTDLHAIIAQQDETIREKNQLLQLKEATIKDYHFRMDVLAEHRISLIKRDIPCSLEDPFGAYTYDLEILG